MKVRKGGKEERKMREGTRRGKECIKIYVNNGTKTIRDRVRKEKYKKVKKLEKEERAENWDER